jgi:hypothetical protein
MLENPGGTATRRDEHLARLRSVCDAGTKICPPERATIEANHEAFAQDRTVVRSPDVDALLVAAAPVSPRRGPPELTQQRFPPALTPGT